MEAIREDRLDRLVVQIGNNGTVILFNQCFCHCFLFPWVMNLYWTWWCGYRLSPVLAVRYWLLICFVYMLFECLGTHLIHCLLMLNVLFELYTNRLFPLFLFKYYVVSFTRHHIISHFLYCRFCWKWEVELLQLIWSWISSIHMLKLKLEIEHTHAQVVKQNKWTWDTKFLTLSRSDHYHFFFNLTRAEKNQENDLVMDCKDITQLPVW